MVLENIENRLSVPLGFVKVVKKKPLKSFDYLIITLYTVLLGFPKPIKYKHVKSKYRHFFKKVPLSRRLKQSLFLEYKLLNNNILQCNFSTAKTTVAYNY